MCFLRFSKQKGVDDSDLYYFKDKGASIKSTSKLEALGRTLLHTLFYPEQSVEFWQNLHISQASQFLVWCRKKICLKKFAEANFSNLVEGWLGMSREDWNARVVGWLGWLWDDWDDWGWLGMTGDDWNARVVGWLGWLWDDWDDWDDWGWLGWLRILGWLGWIGMDDWDG